MTEWIQLCWIQYLVGGWLFIVSLRLVFLLVEVKDCLRLATVRIWEHRKKSNWISISKSHTLYVDWPLGCYRFWYRQVSHLVCGSPIMSTVVRSAFNWPFEGQQRPNWKFFKHFVRLQIIKPINCIMKFFLPPTLLKACQKQLHVNSAKKVSYSDMTCNQGIVVWICLLSYSCIIGWKGRNWICWCQGTYR